MHVPNKFAALEEEGETIKKWGAVTLRTQSNARVDILFRLPHLSYLDVNSCTVTPGGHIQPSAQALHVSHFHLCHNSEVEHGEDYWIPLLHPDHLRVLKTAFEPRFMRRTVHTISSFPNVHKLEPITHNTTPSQNLTVMSKFPGVRILKLWGKGLDTDAVAVQAVPVFPHLEEYYGSYQALPLFLTATTLTRIQTKCSRPEDLLIRIQGIQGHKITSFNAKFTKFDNAAFNKIVKLLPQLTELIFTVVVPNTSSLFTRVIYDDRKLPKGEIVDGRYDDEGVRSGFALSAFFLKLADAPFLPYGLERLAIHWECYEEFYDLLSSYKLPDFPHMRDTLVARCPGLRWLWFSGIYFRFEWRDPMPDGTVKEYIGKNFMDAYCQFPDIFRGWEVM
ncbi:hypothetical protein B0H13DRAFT_2433663 [Mycena leptocephala]|nr:hypothetical protein B0H13DRAFT_2433663 [Mycena leptocephala]